MDQASEGASRQQDHQIRVFISSTFRDMHAERDHLVTVVFPELRDRVELLGLEFYDVDLRWGVPEQDVNGETSNPWEYCKKWIDRVDPFFVSLLGQRYGFVPEPQQIRDRVDRRAYASLSITEMEIRHAALVGRVRRRSFFYLRMALVPDNADAAARATFVESEANVGRLKALIKSGSRPFREYPCVWNGDGFSDLEAFGRMVLEDLWSGVLRDERYVSKDLWRQMLGTEPDLDPRYTDEFEPVPPELAERLVALAKPLPLLPVDAERQQIVAFAESHRRWFRGRDREIRQLLDFVSSAAADAPRLTVVAAAPGQGKSALMARLWRGLMPSAEDRGSGSQDVTSTAGPAPSALVLAHFVGVSERPADARSLVERLLDELDHSGIAWPVEEDPKHDLNSLCVRFANRLGDYAGERRIVLILDALNQLSDGHELNWLPHRLGPQVRVVVSCVDDSGAAEGGPEKRVLRALDDFGPEPKRLSLGPLSEPDISAIVTGYLREYCKELAPPHVTALCRVPQAGNPLYLLVMLDVLRSLGGADMNRIVPRLIGELPVQHPDTVSLFQWVLKRLEVFGEEEVRLWCMYLSLGRAGMSSQELANLLEFRLGPRAALAARRVERGLRRYLQRRGPQLDFFHSQLRQAVVARYGAGADAAELHGQIADYFRGLADPGGNQSWEGVSERPFLQLVYHLAGARQLGDLCHTLCDLLFIQARCRHGQVVPLQADYHLAIEALPEAHAELVAERERSECVRRWTVETITYAKAWSDRRDQLGRGETVAGPDPQLPAPPAACRMWTEEEIEAECRRLVETPTRRDRLEAFAGFVTAQYYPLLGHGGRPGFVLQHAFNAEPAGPVHAAAAVLVPSLRAPHALRRWPPDARHNPKPTLLSTLEGHIDRVLSVSVTPNSQRAVSVCYGDLRVWELSSGACLRTIEFHDRAVSCVGVTPDGRHAVSGSWDKTLRVWDLDSGALLRTLEGHDHFVSCVSVTPDGRRAVSGGYDHTLRVWDVKSGTCVRILEGHGDTVNCVSMTMDGRRAVSGSGGVSHTDLTLRVWDLESGACVRTLEGHTGRVLSVAATPDGRLAVSGGSDQTLRVWDAESGVCLRTLAGHGGAVASVSVTADGRRAVSASQDRTLRVWDLESGVCVRTMEGHSGGVLSVAVTPDGRRVVSGSWDTTLRVWDSEIGVSLRSLEGHDDGINSVSVAPDALHAVSVSHYSLRVWDLESGICLRPTEGQDDWFFRASVTLDNRRVLSVSSVDTLRVWDLESGVCLRTLRGNGNHIVKCVAVMADGRRAVSGSDDSDVLVWDLVGGACLCTLKGHRCGVNCLSVTPDGQRVISGSLDKTVRVWNLASGACLRTMEGHSRSVECLSVTPDGRCAVSGSNDNTLRVWDLASGACLCTLEGHSDKVNCVSVTPDGRRVVSGSEDSTLRVWDIGRGSCQVAFIAPAPVRATAVLGDAVMLGTATGAVLFLDLHGIMAGPAILTAADCRSARCPACGRQLEPSDAIIMAIRSICGHLTPGQSPCLDLPAFAFADPRLLSACPHCHSPLRFNPFLAGLGSGLP
jgi:WD40 repeat protein